MNPHRARVCLMMENRSSITALVALALEPYRKAILSLHKKH